MPAPSLLYRLAALATRAVLPLAGLFKTRLRRMRAERREFARQLTSTDRKSPTILLHAASAGELRQLEPVVRRLRQRLPGARLIVTWFSTSGAEVGMSLGADLAGALPWDTPWETGTLFDHASPALIVVGKLDLWPELAWQAERRGIPVVLASATVRWNSSRLSWPTRTLLRPAYAGLAAAGAISDEDAGRLEQLGVSRTRITVTGDPRYDSVVERLAVATPVARDPMLLVAGSTWPVDELLLLHAFSEVRAQHPAARLLLVPHQPTSAVLERITGLAEALSLPVPSTEVDSNAALTVDMTVGGLVLTYRRAAMAYVGGGFNLSGPHSVLEPAAFGVPVVIGSMSSSHEALLLEAAGGLIRLDNDGAMAELPNIWRRWLNETAARDNAGAAARALVLRELGAADRTVDLLLTCLPPHLRP